MSLSLCILASGSGGNCTALRSPHALALIDAGIGPRTAAQRLQGTGVSVADVSAICLTHLDRDHFCTNWLATILDRRIQLFCHHRRVPDLLDIARQWHAALPPGRRRDHAHELPSLITPFDSQPFDLLPSVTATPIALAHDRTGSHGFLIESPGCRIGYATDLGRVPPHLIESFQDVDVLALESNYDTHMQQTSTRPWFLKQRIMGGAGHLSNDQAFAAVRTILNRAQNPCRLPSHIVLLHRSRQCNCPHLLRKLFTRDPRIAPRLVLAEQFERSEWLRARREPAFTGAQLSLAWA